MQQWNAKEIQRLIDRLQCTPADLAKTIGMSESGLRHHMNGTRTNPNGCMKKLLTLVDLGVVKVQQ